MTEIEDTSRTIEEEFGSISERKRYTNTWGMSEKQLARRKIEVQQLEKLYPTIPAAWIETMWSLCETKTQEELEEMIRIDDEKTNPAYKNRQTGGVMKGLMSVEDRPEEEKTR